MRRLLSLGLALLLTITGCAGAPTAGGASAPAASFAASPAQSESFAAAQDAPISFTDDEGRQITLDAPCTRIISLYSAHTENLYTLGAGDRLIGAHSTSIFPAEAALLERYDYNGDPERIIAAEPDCVLIRPFITNKSPDFVKALEGAGITVISLYPETLAGFDGYIERLALVAGKQREGEAALAAFHTALDALAARTAGQPERQRVFFESTEVNLRTVTPDSMAGLAIESAGGSNVAADAVPVNEGSSIASFGAERILSLANEIDVYVSQRGAMNAGGNLHAILARPGFDALKAVREGRVYLIDEKLISSPTFRYVTGVRELARFLYPELIDSLAEFEGDDTPADRRALAVLLLRARHLPVYTVSSSKYYTESHTGHVYGRFADLPAADPDFDAIETLVISGAIDWEARDGLQYYSPDKLITRELLAKAIFILWDIPAAADGVTLADEADCETPAIARAVAAAGLFELRDGRFDPQGRMTRAEVAQTLVKLQEM